MDLLFYFFSALMLGSAILVIASRNPVSSAMFLLLVFFFMAGLFVLLEAFFLAAIQILVYAGAVIVLFLFVMMLLDIHPDARSRIKKGTLAGGLVVGGLFLVEFVAILERSGFSGAPKEALSTGTRAIGKLLFSGYLLPFEITSLILLAALIGAVMLNRKESR